MASTHDDRAGDELPRLIQAHPMLFSEEEFKIPSELPAGWFPIADALCTDLEALLGDQAARFTPVQSKEKWGSWRFYWRLEPAPGEVAAAEAVTADIMTPTDPAGVGRLDDADVQVTTTIVGHRLSVLPTGELRRAMYARVRQAEAETERTCMWCGAPGIYWTTGWVHVACDQHRRSKAMTLDEWHRRVEERRRKLERDHGNTKGDDHDK